MAICTVMYRISPPPTLTGVAEAPATWVPHVRQGLPLSILDEALADGRITAAELDRLALSRKTLAHRRTLGSLTPDQSDRFLRLLRMIDETETTFGDRAKAHTWLRRPTPLLDG